MANLAPADICELLLTLAPHSLPTLYCLNTPSILGLGCLCLELSSRGYPPGLLPHFGSLSKYLLVRQTFPKHPLYKKAPLIYPQCHSLSNYQYLLFLAFITT